jgi:hypothetical protein
LVTNWETEWEHQSTNKVFFDICVIIKDSEKDNESSQGKMNFNLSVFELSELPAFIPAHRYVL